MPAWVTGGSLFGTKEIIMTASDLIAIASILATAGVAIFSIRKAAENSKVTTIHQELIKVLADSYSVMSKMIKLLRDIGYHVVYTKVPDEEIVESAHKRYWRELGHLSDEFNELQFKQRLVVPKNLYDEIQRVVVLINDGKALVKGVSIEEDKYYSDTSELCDHVKNLIHQYRFLLNQSREYIEPDLLKPLAHSGDKPMFGPSEETKIEPRATSTS
jgi:hypothetical protein